MAALAIIASTRRYLADLCSPWHFEDDVRQHVWWTYRFADASLFPNDLAADYFSAATFAPLGYQALARTFVPHLDAQVFSEIIPFVLTAIVAVFAVLLGRSVSGGSWLGAASAGIFALQGGVLARVEGGLPRAWAMPVLLFGLWAVLEKRWAAFGVALLLTALFYPPLIVNLGMVGGMVLLIEVARSRGLPRGWIAMAALGAAALLIVALAYRAPSPDPLGPKVSEAVARTMPEFGPEGRSQFFSDDPLSFYVTNLRSGLGFEPWKLAALVSALAIGAWLFPKAVPQAVWLIPATALVGFAAAHLVLFKLHLPSRYTRFALPAFFMLWTGAIVPVAVARLRANVRFQPLLALLERPRVLVPALAVAVAILAIEGAVHARKDLARTPAPGYRDLVAFVSRLPPDTVIAAHPADASSIPLLARRSVLASEETSTPYDLGYYATMKERITSELEACYASDWEAVDALARHGVGVFVVDRARYAKPVDRTRIYYEPFQSAIAPAVARGEAAGFVLDAPPKNRILFDGGRFLAVRVNGN